MWIMDYAELPIKDYFILFSKPRLAFVWIKIGQNYDKFMIRKVLKAF